MMNILYVDSAILCDVLRALAAHPEDDVRAEIRGALQAYRPMEELCKGLLLGETIQQAGRRAVHILGLDSCSTSGYESLARLGSEVGILEDCGGKIAIAPAIVAAKENASRPLTLARLDSDAAGRLFSRRQLGKGAYGFLDDADRKLLADALISHAANPGATADSAGKAVESFLRRVAVDKGCGRGRDLQWSGRTRLPPSEQEAAAPPPHQGR